jgi:pyruvate formate lyase activating enzyme
LKTSFIGIGRNRLATDGEGVTTLVAFWGCPLACKYCLNPQSLSEESIKRVLTAEEMYNLGRIDELYLVAPGGGITFGGGEPCLYTDFIKEFRNLCGEKWCITLETSLNVSLENIKALYSSVNEYIVDIKDMNPEIYKSYTGKDNILAITNLKYLIEQGKADNIRVRVPLIQNFNTEKDTKRTVSALKKLGIQKIENFTYIIKTETS